MAFPQVETTAVTNQSTATTSHIITMPAGTSAGDLILVFFAHDFSSLTTSWPAGWTKLEGDYHLAVGWRKATGTDSLTITLSGSDESASIAYRISGAEDPTVTPPFSDFSQDSGTSTTPDPPNLATGTEDDYLWIAGEGNDDDDMVTVWPTDYNDNRLNQAGGTTCAVGACSRELRAATENPGAFTIASAENWGAATVAVPPSTAVAGTNTQINIGDDWKSIDAAQINIGDDWKAVAGMQINIGDTWKEIF